jgi:hypothetical protein
MSKFASHSFFQIRGVCSCLFQLQNVLCRAPRNLHNARLKGLGKKQCGTFTPSLPNCDGHTNILPFAASSQLRRGLPGP